MKPETFEIPADGRALLVQRMAEWIASAWPGKKLAVTVRPVGKARSNQQNRALFGVAYGMLMNEMGLSGEDEKMMLHYRMCKDFFGVKVVPMLGSIPVRTTTKDADNARDVIGTRDFSAFYAFVQRRASEYFNIVIPDPDTAATMEPQTPDM